MLLDSKWAVNQPLIPFEHPVLDGEQLGENW
jgi:hypothetical protein